MKSHLDYMKLAYALAEKGRETVSPNPMVGAIIVKNGRVIGQGFHHHAGGPHAEIIAMQQAKHQLKGATLYVTLEPCHHYGRTPPCVDAVQASGLSSVIIGMKDPNPQTNGQSIRQLRKAGLQVTVGVLSKDIAQQNEAFLTNLKYQRPYVVTKTAQSVDGKIALANGESQWITGPQARSYGHRLRNEFDAILVGINTVLHDNPRLNAPKKNKRLTKVILDSTLQISLKARLFKGTEPGQCVVVTTSRASSAKMTSFRKAGVHIWVCPFKNRRVDIVWAMTELFRHEKRKILIEGGGEVIASALKAKMVDKMMIFLAPMIIGDSQAIGSIQGLHPLKMSEVIDLKPTNVRNLGKDLLIESVVGYKHQ